MILHKIRESKSRFLVTMILIIISGMIISYALYNLLDVYFNTADSVYTGVQLNIIVTIAVIGIITVLMLILLPKQTVDQLFSDIENGAASTPEQQLQQWFGSDDDDNLGLENK